MTTEDLPPAVIEADRSREMMMCGEYWRGSTAPGLAEGFRERGWGVAEIDIRDFLLVSDNLALRTANRFLGRGMMAAYNAAIRRHAERWRPGALLAVKGNHIRPETLEAVGRNGVFRTMFYPDFHFNHPGFDDSLFDRYDLVVTTKSFQRDYLERKLGAGRTAFIHHGYSPLVHRRRSPDLREEDYRWDIAHVGSASPNKLALMNAVARAFPDKRIMIAGNGWLPLARGTPVEGFVLGYGVTDDHYARMIELSRINIAVLYGHYGAEGWEDNVSTRTFEIPACGGFMLHIDNTEVRELYDVGTEIDVFADAEALCERVGHYLDHPDERAAMIERAHARAVPAYSLHARAREIEALIRERMSAL